MGKSFKKDVLGKMKRGKSYSAQHFIDKGMGSRNTIAQTLSRMTRDGDVKRTGYGKYELTQPKVNKARSAEMRGMDGLRSRAQFFNQIGMMFDGKRDIWETLGYSKHVSFQKYEQQYRRGDIAGRIVDAPAKATWRNSPLVTSQDDDTEFADAWDALEKRLKVFHKFERADRVTGIGRYGALLIGASDGGNLKLPLAEVGGPEDILYLTPFKEIDAQVHNFVSDTADERFGLPKSYSMNLLGNVEAFTQQFDGVNKQTSLAESEVHHSRIIHIAENLLTDDVFGQPRLERVFNRLQDMEKVVGMSAEAVWRVVDRGMSFKMDPDTTLTPEDEAALDNEIERYLHGGQRYLRLQGVEAKTLGADIVDPRGMFAVLSSIIAGAAEIPQRVLFGSERGQLASTQDERNFNARIAERQTSFAEPIILRPFIDKMIMLGALPEPKGGLVIEWPDLTALSARELAEIAGLKGRAASNLARDTVLTSDEKRDVLGFEPLAGDAEPELEPEESDE